MSTEEPTINPASPSSPDGVPADGQTKEPSADVARQDAPEAAAVGSSPGAEPGAAPAPGGSAAESPPPQAGPAQDGASGDEGEPSAGTPDANQPAEAPAAAEPAAAAWLSAELPRWTSWAALGVGLLLLLSLARLGLWDPWETRRVAEAGALAGATEAARAAVGQAPAAPLSGWLIRGTCAVFGCSELAVRLPGMLSGLLLLGTLLLVGRRRWGAVRALVAGAVLLSTPHFLLQTGLALGNGVLLGLQGTLLLLLIDLIDPRFTSSKEGTTPPPPGKAMLAGVALTTVGTFLAGGVVGLVVPVAVVTIWWLLAPRDGRRRSVGLALLGALLVGVAGAALTGGGALWGLGAPSGAVARSTADATFEHLIQHVALGLFPWSLLLPAGAAVMMRRTSADGLLVVAWLGLSFIVAGAAGRLGAQPLFLALPAAAIAVSGLLGRLPVSGTARRLSVVVLLALLWVVGQGLVKAPAVALADLVGEGFRWPGGLRYPLVARVLVGLWAALLVLALLQPVALLQRLSERFGQLARGSVGALLSWVGRLSRPQRALPGAALLALGLAGVLALVLIPRMTHSLSQRGLLDSWTRHADESAQLFTYLAPAESSPFYLGELKPLATRGRFLEQFSSSKPTFAIIPRDRLAEVDSTFRGSTGRHLTVLDDRSAELLLVANHLPEGAEDRNPLEDIVLSEKPSPAHPVGATLDDKLELLGVDLSEDSVGVGQSFVITTYFKVLRPVSRDWKVFLHMEKPTYRIDTSATDHQPARGLYPTSDWRVGDVIKDSYTVHVPFFSPPGEFRLRMGLFIGNRRMKVRESDKHDGKNRVHVGRIQVTPF